MEPTGLPKLVGLSGLGLPSMGPSGIKLPMEPGQGPRTSTIQPREMTAEEEAALMPEIMALTNASMAASHITPADFDPYRGQFVAWSPDGKHIIAHAKDSDTLDRNLKELGVDTNLCVIQFVHDIQDHI